MGRVQLTRRQALTGLASAFCAGRMGLSAASVQKADNFPETGTSNPAFAPFDDLIAGFMRERGVPGGSLAVVRQGRLVYARGYGWADREAQIPYAPTQLFRIASLSKSLTSAAIVALVQQGKLRLDEGAFGLLDLEPPVGLGTMVDPRLKSITVRQLLHHSGGFDRDVSFDPMFVTRQISQAMGVPSPPGPREIVRYMMGRPLDFAPGTRFAYSNFGYCVLGRIVEKVTGDSYDGFVQKTILKPLGVTQMRLGKSRWDERAANEVRYYDGANRHVPSVFAADKGAMVPVPYGGWCIEAMDAHGGWLASVVDLARFASALDARDNERGLTASTRALLYERPAPPLGVDSDGRPSAAFYGMGWMVRPTVDGRANYWHSGKLDGSSSLMVRRHDGLTWVLNFNSEIVGPESLASLLDGPLHGAADAVRAWPTHDLFGEFGIAA